MLEFRAENDKLKGWRGLACVAAIVAVIVLDSLLSSLVIRIAGDLVGNIVFWVIGGAVALWSLRYFIMGYRYRLNEARLDISHLYSHYERPLETIYANSIISAGEPEAVLKRYPNARIVQALLRRCPVPPFAVAFRREGACIVYLIQVSPEMREKLGAIAKRNAK